MQDRLGDLWGSNDQYSKVEDSEIKTNEVRLDVLDSKASTPGAGGEEDPVMQRFEQLKSIVDRIESNSELVAKLRVEANKESTQDGQQRILNKLESTMDETRGLAKKAQTIMKQCKEDNVEYRRKNNNSPSAQFRDNMLNSHARSFQKAVEKFQTSSAQFKKSLRDKIMRQLKIVEPDITDEKAEEIADSPNPQDYVKNIMMGRSEEIEDRVAEIEERHEGIMRIEQGVKEIQELFNDLAFLVEIQGEKLQNIEENVDQTKRYTGETVNIMKDAEKNAKRARKKQCYILLCCLVILVVILAPTLLSVIGNA